jgi:hypothetical protein
MASREGRALKITRAHEARIVALLTHDVEATLGGGQNDVIRSEAAARREFFNDPHSIDADWDGYMEKVAEEVQQYFHDCFIDITWPECPLHRRHPLWLHHGSWTCEQLHAPIARLGELRASPDSAGHYVIEPAP